MKNKLEWTHKGLIIRQFLEEDIDKLLEINDQIINSMENKNHYYSPTKEWALKVLSNKENLIVGIYNQLNELMAYATLICYYSADKLKEALVYYKNSKVEDFWYFNNVAVLPMFRGNAIQQKITDFFEEYVIKKEGKFIISNVHPDNLYSFNNFMKSGYEVINKIYYANKEPRLVVSKKLIETKK